MSEIEEKVEVPIVQEEFANFLRKYKVHKGGEMCDTIAENIAETGGPSVFEVPEILATGLAKWSEYIGAPLRKQVLEHWCAKKDIAVSQEALEAASVTAKTEAAVKKKRAKEGKETSGALWTVDVDDSGTPRIRMIKDATEPGTTLEEAKAAAASIGKEGEQPIVTFNEDLGKHMPNFKSAFVKQNPNAAWATARQMDRAMVEGEPVDPMEIWLDQLAKLGQMKELMGISPETKEKGTVGEIISGLKELQSMAESGKVSGLPDWMSNPMEFIKTVREITGESEGGGKPSWMSDPMEFIKVIREISSEGKGDDKVQAQITELTTTITTMREEAHKREMDQLTERITAQAQTHQKQMVDIAAKIDEMGKPITGRTELDILHDIATEGLGILKTEAVGMRGMLKEVVGGVGVSSTKTPEERERRKGQYRQALEDDKEIEDIGQRLFFNRS